MPIKIQNESLEKKISKIKSKDSKRGEKLLEALVPYAREYINKTNNEFAIWLNKETYFKNAKDRLIKQQLISANEDCLEFICANAIQAHNHALLTKAVVPQKKIDSIRKMAEKLKRKLALIDGFIFESEPKQALLQFLLANILKSPNESALNSGARHSKLSREVFIKKVIYQLEVIFTGKKHPHSSLVDTAIDISAIFFPLADRSDHIEKAKTLSKIGSEDMMFMEKTVKELLAEYQSELNMKKE